MSKYIKCPRCRCTDLYVVEDISDKKIMVYGNLVW